MLVFAIISAPFVALGPRKIAEWLPDSWDNVLAFGYYPVLFLVLVVAMNILYRVSLPKPLPSHRLLLGSVLGHSGVPGRHVGLRVYLTWITATGYTYGALATPIAFLLFAFFLGFAIMLGAELNAAIQEEWPAPATHAKRFRWWLEEKAESLNGSTAARSRAAADTAATTATLLLELSRRSACSPGRPASRAWPPSSPETPRRTARRRAYP